MDHIDEIIDHLGVEALEDFAVNVKLELETIEHYVMTLDSGEYDDSIFDKLVGSLNKIKNYCRIVFMDPFVAYVQVVEDLVDQVYRHHVKSTPDLSELVLLMFDEMRAASEEIYFRHSLDVALLDEFRKDIKDLIAAPRDRLNANVVAMVSHFAYRVDPDMVFTAKEVHAGNREQIQAQLKFSNEDGAIKEELATMEDLALAMDSRSPYTAQRTARLLELALAINNRLPERCRVDEQQLKAAVYMHDIGMLFIADDIVFKPGKYSSDEVMMLEQHPHLSYRLLSLIPNWQEAAEMVYQHHERYDGKGYPKALLGPQICQGAKILAVVDTFDALTNERADRPFKKSVLRAMMEINKNNGTQFDPSVVEALNESLQAAN